MAKIRIIIAIFANIFLIFCGIIEILSIITIGWTVFLNNDVRLYWSYSDPGYLLHVSSAFFEWLCVLSLSPFFMTFIRDFKRIDWKYLRETKVENTIDLNIIKTNELKANEFV